jgi:hypothetical protein
MSWNRILARSKAFEASDKSIAVSISSSCISTILSFNKPVPDSVCSFHARTAH